jgi:quercetin dioxygenase-like cupin family protein
MSGDELEARLVGEGLSASAWENGPGERYAAHQHGYDKVLVVAAGAIRFGLPDVGRDMELGVGDRLDLPAGTAHNAVVGPSGVRCLEAHAPRGTLASAERRGAGTW